MPPLLCEVCGGREVFGPFGRLTIRAGGQAVFDDVPVHRWCAEMVVDDMERRGEAVHVRRYRD